MLIKLANQKQGTNPKSIARVTSPMPYQCAKIGLAQRMFCMEEESDAALKASSRMLQLCFCAGNWLASLNS